MNPLVKKEIRLLLPGWLVVLALEVLLPWLLKDINTDMAISIAPIFFFLGMILLAIDSFGREFSLATFPSLMSQPVERRQIWRTKMTVLLLASVLILVAYFVSYDIRLHEAFANVNSIWHGNSKIIGGDFRNSMIASAALLFVALTSGLWTSLLFRQTAAAFWITLLIPLGLETLFAFLMSKFLPNASDVVAYSVIYGAAGIYSVAGFWLARRLFHRAQDAVWLDGTINFSTWRYFQSGKQAVVSVRRHHPMGVLLKKEFQLHSVSLICASAILALHIAALIVRAAYGDHHKDSFVYGLTTMFWIFWLLIPLILGCTAVAEERKLGMADGQFCLPASRWKQFMIKLFPVLILGTLLGGVMPILVEGVAGRLGAPNEIISGLADFYNRQNSEFGPGLPLAQISVVLLSAGMAWVGFFASTLAKNFLQALGIAIVIFVGCCVFVSSNGPAAVVNITIYGVKLWHSALPILIAIPAILITLLWLAWLNFSHYRQGWRLWRRDVLGLIGALAFVAASSAAIYNRVWEVFEPAEPPHGPAVFSAANRPVLSSDHYFGLRVRLPDGRIWFDSLDYPPAELPYSIWWQLWESVAHPLPFSVGPKQFMGSSNWVSATTRYIQSSEYGRNGIRRVIAGYLDTVGIKADGTLWISSEAKPAAWTGANMIRFGGDTNWQRVVRISAGLLLLKTDGTLWQWGTNRLDWSHLNSNWPTVRKSKPLPLGTNSDRREIFGRWNLGFARERDGNVWSIDRDWQMERQTNLDQVVSQTFSGMMNGPMAYVTQDGTLWANDRYYDQSQNRIMGTGRFFPTGKETDWAAVEVGYNGMIALKSDGSLWQWRWNYNQESALEAARKPPTRLGIHNDWIGLTSVWGSAATLAADGSLWLWPNMDYIGYFQFQLMKAPKQPEFLGNVFGKSN
ncbi:MAG TPA: hypothetical protein VFY06_12370 [Verrucomicrobiae bacterium]|nr:hypothetical protein [Verrucomicrobiae bacterium]